MKKTISALLILLFAALVIVPASASADSGAYVYDLAKILSRSEAETLEDMAEAVSTTHGCGVYIITVDDYTEYVSGGVWEFTEFAYDDLNLGLGSDRNCVVLALSMSDRDYDLMAHGSLGNAAFTDYSKGWLEDRFLDDFRENDWYGGFEDYINGSEDLIVKALQGEPMDVNNTPAGNTAGVVVSLLLAAIIAAIVCAIFSAQMKSVSLAKNADQYVVGGLLLAAHSDQFTHTTQVTRVIESSSGRGGGGGGTSVNSGGFSHSSGKF